MVYMVDELGVQRRPLLKGAIALGLAPLGLVAAAPLIGGLIQNPHKDDEPFMFRTGFDPVANNGQPVRLTREDGSPIRPEDVSVGGQITVFPGIPGGATNEYADSPTLLIHLRAGDAEIARQASDSDPHQPGRDVGQLCRVLEDLHARRLPRQPVRAADQPVALPVPPVPVPDHGQCPTHLRPGQPPPARPAA